MEIDQFRPATSNFTMHRSSLYHQSSARDRYPQQRKHYSALDTDQPSAGATSPLVSVITVCRNAESTIDACIQSVAGQSYAPVEHIIIDGASTDRTGEILERHSRQLAVVVSEPDRGIYDAMNKGVARARGDFVIFINADDRFVGPHALRDAMAEIARHPEGDVYYGCLEVRDGPAVYRHSPAAPEQAAEEMVLGCLPHQATLARRSVFERTGPFDLRWRRHADYDWWLKVMSDPTLRLRRIDTVIASFAMGGASSDLAKGQPEVFAIQNGSPLFRTPEWDRRRIEMFQNAWLQARIEAAQLRAAMAVPPGVAPNGSRQSKPVWQMLRPGFAAPGLNWKGRMATVLPPALVRRLRDSKRRLLGP